MWKYRVSGQMTYSETTTEQVEIITPPVASEYQARLYLLGKYGKDLSIFNIVRIIDEAYTEDVKDIAMEEKESFIINTIKERNSFLTVQDIYPYIFSCTQIKLVKNHITIFDGNVNLLPATKIWMEDLIIEPNSISITKSSNAFEGFSTAISIGIKV